jgi:hypothetical protein
VVFSTNKTDCQDVTGILLKVALNTINITPYPSTTSWIIAVTKNNMISTYLSSNFGTLPGRLLLSGAIAGRFFAHSSAIRLLLYYHW